MVTFRIKLVHNDIVVFSINDEIYYLKPGPEYPKLYNSYLEKQIVHNFDDWFQNKTHQQYSYQNVINMSQAFVAGMHVAYTYRDLSEIIKVIIKKTINIIFRRGFILQYLKLYWIEAIEPLKLRTVYGKILRDKFEDLKKTNQDQLYNDLCRMWYSCTINANINSNETEVEIFNKLISKLNKTPNQPNYPNTIDIDSKLNHIIDIEFINKLPKYKISNQLVDNIQLID